MKQLFILLSIAGFYSVSAQVRGDSLLLIEQWAKWYDLNFTRPEADSMLSTLQSNTGTYRALHKTLPQNSLPYPFSFQPSPSGAPGIETQQLIDWDIPADVPLPKNKNELAFYSIPQLASLIRSGRITSVALTRFFLNRLKRWADTLKCTITLTEDLAMREAAKADEDLKNGIYHGPLHGIPYGLKDLFAVRSYKTTWGTAAYKDQIIDDDAYVYTQLKKTGAVLCAKLSLGALAYNDRWFGGQTRNPWNLKEGSSGSSAGPAAATVAGLLPFAIGTETLGSIVSPSHRCRATGLRPTFGTVSRSGAMVLCWSLDKAGPICRSAEDAAIVYYFIRGSDSRDPGAVYAPFNYHPHGDIRKMRIGYAANYFSALPKDAPEWSVLEVYRGMGAVVQPVQFPDGAPPPFDTSASPSDIVGLILVAEAGAAFDELVRSNRDDLIERQDKDFWPNIFRSAHFIPAVEYINANRYRAALGSKLQAFMKSYDVVIVPTFAGHQLAVTNLTGNPALCMPVGVTKKGEGASITLIGNLYDEAAIMEAAKAYQNKTAHNRKHPPLFTGEIARE